MPMFVLFCTSAFVTNAGEECDEWSRRLIGARRGDTVQHLGSDGWRQRPARGAYPALMELESRMRRMWAEALGRL